MTSPAETLTLPLSSLPPLSRGLVGLALVVRAWEERSQTRRALTRLDSHLLRDIGLGARDAEDEARKPFWRL